MAAIGSAATSNPAIDSRPRLAGMIPAIARIVVVLPAPLGPIMRQQLARLDAKRDASHRDVVGKRLVKIVDFDHARLPLNRTGANVRTATTDKNHHSESLRCGRQPIASTMYCLLWTGLECAEEKD